ncbi:hypothetical protein M378DRAFT_14063 [Amanita muscaria Koide BX008]|uniref:Uncharacterized protein n=1 Tax=Amanita muscaria (strain Koide BX008) TaxID=946122 RepID=A0A0C2WUZ1_AMAMK|nr:hypothetical protein M378DRAFT_14063 [Amanita muscaria Koide BX008]
MANVSHSVAEESKGVGFNDKLLRTVRELSDPRYHNIMPTRTGGGSSSEHSPKKTATIVKEREAPSQIQESWRMDDSYSLQFRPAVIGTL